MRRVARHLGLQVGQPRAGARDERHVARVALDDAGPLFDTGIHPDRSHESSEVRAWLRATLAKLSPRPAEIFILRYLEDYGNREIARMLSISQVTVGVILHRVRAQLRKDYRAFMRGRHDRQK